MAGPTPPAEAIDATTPLPLVAFFRGIGDFEALKIYATYGFGALHGPTHD